MDKDVINKTEFVKETVAKLKYFAQLYGINSLFLVGGYCRSTYFNDFSDLHDLDVASAYDRQAVEMAGLFASEIVNSVPTIYERTQTAMVEYKSGDNAIRIEFQGKSPSPYMYNQEIRDWMHNQGIEDVPLMHNIYGRDFTINSLIYSLFNENMYDLTERAVEDLDRGRIVSILPAAYLIKYNPLAALRAIRFSLRYEFSIDEELKDAIKNSYPFIAASLSEERVAKELVRILTIDGERAISVLKENNLDRLLLIPMVRQKAMEVNKDE